MRQSLAQSDKGWTVAFCLSVFLGYFGADRFYLGYGFLGILKLCTFGGMGLWWVFDILLLLAGKMRDSEGGVVRRPFGRS